MTCISVILSDEGCCLTCAGWQTLNPSYTSHPSPSEAVVSLCVLLRLQWVEHTASYCHFRGVAWETLKYLPWKLEGVWLPKGWAMFKALNRTLNMNKIHCSIASLSIDEIPNLTLPSYYDCWLSTLNCEQASKKCFGNNLKKCVKNK